MRKRSSREVRLLLFRSRKKICHRQRQRKKRQANAEYLQDQQKLKEMQYTETVSKWGLPRKVTLTLGANQIEAAGIPLKPPENFSLEQNSAEVIQFLEKFRTRTYREQRSLAPKSIIGRRKWIDVYIDFTQIKEISTAAALVLAAEFYRARYASRIGAPNSTSRPPGLVDFDQWQSETVQALSQLGFLELLDVNLNARNMLDANDSNRNIQQFMTGNQLNPKDVENLKDGLSKLTTGLETAGGVKFGIYDGLCEAMTNTIDHAYQFPEDLQLPYLQGQWWMTGSVNANGSEIDVVFFDQGVSIPCHLPKTKREYVEKLFRSQAANDAKMIKAAMEERRSSTNESNRGRGLVQIQNLIDHAQAGRLRILSRSGEYIYQKGEGKEGENVRSRTLKGDIGGTLIHWSLNVKSG